MASGRALGQICRSVGEHTGVGLSIINCRLLDRLDMGEHTGEGFSIIILL